MQLHLTRNRHAGPRSTVATPDRHLQVIQLLGGRISRGELRPGDHLPPEPELARQLGVSRFTLRKALDSLAGDGRVVRQRGLGTRVADSRIGGGALVSYLGETDTHVYADLFVALTRASQAAGMHIQELEPALVHTYQPLVRRDGRDLVNHLVCAGSPARLLDRLPHEPHAIRVLTGLRRGSTTGFNYAILADHGDALRQMVGRLAGLGHRRIALVMSDAVEPAPSVSDLYRIAIRYHGLEWQRVLATSGPDTGWGAQLTTQLRVGARPTAVVCEMDFMAVHLFDAAKALGWSIPDDLSVIGMYDTPWSQVLRPQLATIAFPIDLIARLAIACLSAGRPAAPRQVGVQGTLLDRATMAPPP